MSCMNDKFLFDTNIIIYAHDISELEKKDICARLLENVYENELTGVVSNQILGEVFKGLTKNIEKPISVEEAKLVIENIIDSDSWTKINYTHETVKRTILTVKVHKAPFWDSLIAETMKENGIVKIYTENEKDFKKIPGIKVVNPFKKENSKNMNNSQSNF